MDEDKLADQVIGLITHQDDVVAGWISRLFALESGFAVAVAAVLGFQAHIGIQSVKFIAVLLALMAAVLGFAIHLVIVRELKWQNVYVDAFKILEKDNPILFREGMITGGIKVIQVMWGVSLVLLAGWIAVMLVVLCGNVTVPPVTT